MSCYRHALELDENDVEALEGLVDTYLHAFSKCPKYKEAIFVAQKVYTRMTSNPRVEVVLGNVLSMSRTPKTRDKARTLFKNALKRHRQQGSNFMNSLQGLIKLYVADKEYQLGVETLRDHLDRILKDSETSTCIYSASDIASLWSRLGQLYFLMGDNKNAFESYQSAILAGPDSCWPPASLGMEEIQESLSYSKAGGVSAAEEKSSIMFPF